MAGAARRRSLLLWHAAEVTRSAAAVGSTLSLPTEVSRAADRLEITRLRLTLRGMDPLPDDLTAMQVRGRNALMQGRGEDLLLVLYGFMIWARRSAMQVQVLGFGFSIHQGRSPTPTLYTGAVHPLMIGV